MIAIIVRQPNGNGTYTARCGFTTDDSASTLDGVTLVPGFLEAVSELSHRINISSAQGGTPEPIEWGFDLIDWETTARRSVGILDGSVQLVGWVASLYVKLPATGIWSAPVLGENAFEIVAAPVSDGTISISCRERWIGKAQAVGFGVDGNRVGLVVGGLDVSIKSQEIGSATNYTYNKLSPGLLVGRPHASELAGTFSDKATSWQEGAGGYRFVARFDSQLYCQQSYISLLDEFPPLQYTSIVLDLDGLGYTTYCYSRIDANIVQEEFINNLSASMSDHLITYGVDQVGFALLFQCYSQLERDDLFSRMQSGLSSGQLFVVGNEFAEAVTNITQTANFTVSIQTSRFFNAVEPDATKISVYAQSTAFTPVAGGVSGISGWVSDSNIVMPKGQSTIDGNVLSFAPAVTSPDGFVAATVIPVQIAFHDSEWTRTGSDLVYYGRTDDIRTDGSESPADALDSSNLSPISGTSSFGIWGSLTSSNLKVANFGFRARALDLDASRKYSRVYADQSLRLTIKNNTVGSTSINYGWPFNSDQNQNSRNINTGTQSILAIALNGGIENNEKQIFGSIDEANAQTQFVIGFPYSFAGSFDFYFQARSMTFYGTSILKFGSSYAVVTPGASPWWASTPSPAEAASALLASAGFTAYTVDTINAPSWVAPTEAWGRAFDQDVTTTEAAKEICREFWLLARRNSVTNQAAADGEILQAPSFTLGDRSDIVTEPVVEYDYWAGEYRRRAYIAHVDEEYNSATPERYFGGWDTTGGGWGLALWNTCRNAWLHHGIQRSETFQSPSIRDPSTLGRMWANSSRSGATRARWLASQARYMTFAVAEIFPDWWAGDSVYPPTVSADAAGYDLSAYASTPLVVTEKRWDPMSFTTSVEVALPPAIPGAGGDVIQQTVSQDDDIIQQTSSISDNILQQVGN